MGESLNYANEEQDETAMANADTHRSELTKERDELMIFNENLTAQWLYQYVAQLVDFGDPDLEAFANYALSCKRLKGISPEQVDLGDLKLTHYKMKKEGGLDGIGDAADGRAQYGISDNGQRDARDRKRSICPS